MGRYQQAGAMISKILRETKPCRVGQLVVDVLWPGLRRVPEKPPRDVEERGNPHEDQGPPEATFSRLRDLQSPPVRRQSVVVSSACHAQPQFDVIIP